jgi:hypothetical protein
MISYQGKLLDAQGQPITGSQDLSFSLYDAQTSGNQLWTETQTATVLSGGLFHVLLGAVCPLPVGAFGGSTWLETKVGTVTMIPRIQIVSAAYALRAQIAETVPEGSITSAQIAPGSVKTEHLADGSVTPAKISGQGAPDTAILTSRSGAVAWEEPFLSVPATATNYTGFDALSITQESRGGSALFLAKLYPGHDDYVPALDAVDYSNGPAARIESTLGTSALATGLDVSACGLGTTLRAAHANPRTSVLLATPDAAGVFEGNTRFTGDVSVTGGMSATGGFAVGGNGSVGGGLTVAGAAGVGGGLTTTGSGTFTNKIGIGTASPQDKLHIIATAGSPGAPAMVRLDGLGSQISGIRIDEDGSTLWSIIHRAWESDNLVVHDEKAHADTLTLQSGTGNVGIGRSDPWQRLEVVGNVVITGDLFVGGAFGGCVRAPCSTVGAPFPRTDFDSGWQLVNPGQGLICVHNLGGSAGDYVVQMVVRKSSDPGHVDPYQPLFAWCIDGDPTPETAPFYWHDLTNQSIKVTRDMLSDNNECRIRIWVVR